MDVVYGVMYGIDGHLLRQLFAANALLIGGYLVWTLFGARTPLGDWDAPRKKFFPVWVVGINLALLLALS